MYVGYSDECNCFQKYLKVCRLLAVEHKVGLLTTMVPKISGAVKLSLLKGVLEALLNIGLPRTSFVPKRASRCVAMLHFLSIEQFG